MNEFVSVRKIIDAKEAYDNKPATSTKVETDTIRLSDIISFRRWHKNDRDKDIEGDITQLTIISRNGGSFTMKIEEAEEKFADRVKDHIHIIKLA